MSVNSPLNQELSKQEPIKQESEELLELGENLDQEASTQNTTTRNTPVPKELQFQVPEDQPVHKIIGGAPVRQWLNEHITPHLLDAVREIAKKQPEDPLRQLGELLITKSEELKK
ncbi:hypothetical protein WICMUC_001458 [Wickerhamomyces mucosus]|uniref:COMPASS component SDC1 n=1 Tax=Wickerhamomyces mucosus TaxID=1378264 RepID=A0A9P8THD8_9ASCO|nr:hypothetical protein WICMUC_001458 [Wickerhamomyces mucosus]